MIINCPYCKQKLSSEKLDIMEKDIKYKKLPFRFRLLQWITLGTYKAAEEKYKLSLNIKCKVCQKIFVLGDHGITTKNKVDLSLERINASMRVYASHC